MKKRSFELLIVLALVVIATGLLKSDRGKDANPEPSPTSQETSSVDLVDSKIGYKLTFNQLRPGMTVAEAEKIYGPPDFTNAERNYQQWERPLTQVYYSDKGVLTEVGGSGLGVLRLDNRVVFQCGQREEDIVSTFGSALSVDDMEYNYPGMMLFCGSEAEGRRRVSAIVLGSHEG